MHFQIQTLLTAMVLPQNYMNWPKMAESGISVYPVYPGFYEKEEYGTLVNIENLTFLTEVAGEIFQ